ncbi:hypothetical protein TcasGA2_TC034389 [Tribolium castaneum]|uniref:Single domain-containing protein n=1 Tax=Tribolium castaneum TaxID=7070 RepID=A0A139WBP5_TRICA|nr:hypothetical protein TcasGA2_TC034389 [Tribolium castaneum]
MRLVVVVLFTFLISYTTEIDVEEIPAHPRRHPGHCYNELFGHLKAGVTIRVPGHCKEARCFPDGSGRAYLISCTSEPNDLGRHCANIYRPFPDCCPVKCNKTLNWWR